MAFQPVQQRPPGSQAANCRNQVLLRDQITSGKIDPRRPIPSIRTLCETYGIARATAGKAIAVLSDEGLIRRVPGKGWFVKPASEWPSLDRVLRGGVGTAIRACPVMVTGSAAVTGSDRIRWMWHRQLVPDAGSGTPWR